MIGHEPWAKSFVSHCSFMPLDTRKLVNKEFLARFADYFSLAKLANSTNLQVCNVLKKIRGNRVGFVLRTR